MKKEIKLGFSERVLTLFFPARCLECGCVIPASELFCAECEKKVYREPCYRYSARPDTGVDGLITVAPMPNEGGFRETIFRYKFRGYRGLSKPIGRLMAEAALDLDKELDCVAYVPLSEKSKRARGFDQAFLLAKAVAGHLELPLVHALKKVKDTGVQHELSRERRFKNVKGAYGAVCEMNGKSVLLVDDISTTGATVTECASVLRKAGAAKVYALCAAITTETSKE